MKTTTRVVAGLCLALWGCTPDAEPEPESLVQPVPPAPGELLIAELYYSGAAPAGGADHYFDDQFIELVNASSVPLDVSGVRIGDAYGVAGPINPGTQPDSYAASNPDEVVLQSVWRIPDGTILEAGDSLVIAHDGRNHRPFSTIDLASADFETYVEESGRDDDHPMVDNLESVRFNGGFDWLVPVFGASIVVLDADIELGRQRSPIGRLSTAPLSAVLDGVDALMDGSSGDFKRLPPEVDAGFAWVSDTYVGESLHRKQIDGVWQDTDDSGADFEVGEPEPGRALDSGGALSDDAWIELGTGRATFEPLAEGDAMELVAGPQGGWHVDVALRFGGLEPEGLELVYDAVDAEGAPISFTTRAFVVEESLLADGDDWIRVGDRIVLDIESPADVVDTEAIVRVTAELAGQTLADERRIAIVDDE
jgi:hypothetical protein